MQWQEVDLGVIIPESMRLPDAPVLQKKFATREEAIHWLVGEILDGRSRVTNAHDMRWVIDEVLAKLFPSFAEAELTERLIMTPFGQRGTVDVERLMTNLPQAVVYTSAAAWF